MGSLGYVIGGILTLKISKKKNENVTASILIWATIILLPICFILEKRCCSLNSYYVNDNHYRYVNSFADVNFTIHKVMITLWVVFYIKQLLSYYQPKSMYSIVTSSPCSIALAMLG